MAKKKKFKKILGGVVRAVAAVYTGGASEAMIAAATARKRGGAAPQQIDTTELLGSYMPASAQSLVNSYRDTRGQARAFASRAGFPQRSPAVAALTDSFERPRDDFEDDEPEEEFEDENLSDEDEEEE